MSGATSTRYLSPVSQTTWRRVRFTTSSAAAPASTPANSSTPAAPTRYHSFSWIVPFYLPTIMHWNWSSWILYVLNKIFAFLFQVVAFATFFNHQSAMAALHALNVSTVRVRNLVHVWFAIGNAAAHVPMWIQKIKAKWTQKQGSWSIGKMIFASNVILQWFLPQNVILQRNW